MSVDLKKIPSTSTLRDLNPTRELDEEEQVRRLLARDRVTIRGVCVYFINCTKASTCLHAKPHTPLYKGYMGSAPSMKHYVENNCMSRTGKIAPCPHETPADRCCLDTNLDDVLARMLKNESKKEIV